MKCATEETQLLPDAHEAEAEANPNIGVEDVRVETDPLVTDQDRERPTLFFERDRGALRLCVLDHVEQQLAHCLEQEDAKRLVLLNNLTVRRDLNGEIVAIRKGMREPLQAGYEPGIVEHRRAQVDRERPRGGDRFAQQVDDNGRHFSGRFVP